MQSHFATGHISLRNLSMKLFAATT